MIMVWIHASEKTNETEPFAPHTRTSHTMPQPWHITTQPEGPGFDILLVFWMTAPFLGLLIMSYMLRYSAAGANGSVPFNFHTLCRIFVSCS